MAFAYLLASLPVASRFFTTEGTEFFLTHLPEDRLSEGRGGDGKEGRRRARRFDLRSQVACRLSLIAYRLSLIAYRFFTTEGTEGFHGGHGVFLTHLPEDRLSEGRGGFAKGAEEIEKQDVGERGGLTFGLRSLVAYRFFITEGTEGNGQAGRRRARRFDLRSQVACRHIAYRLSLFHH